VDLYGYIIFYKQNTRWFKYDRNLCGLFTHKSVPVLFESPCSLTKVAYSLKSYHQTSFQDPKFGVTDLPPPHNFEYSLCSCGLQWHNIQTKCHVKSIMLSQSWEGRMDGRTDTHARTWAHAHTHTLSLSLTVLLSHANIYNTEMIKYKQYQLRRCYITI
jgi:hypothetical protein